MILTGRFVLCVVILAGAVQNLCAQESVLPPAKMLELVPDKIKNFDQLIDPKAVQMQVGTLTYSLCEKNFSNGKKTLKILLFDFKDASIMYAQAMRRWNNQPEIESDSLVQRSVVMSNCSGWESFNSHQQTSQVFLGICDRFFLTITGENVALDELKSVLDIIQFDTFPK